MCYGGFDSSQASSRSHLRVFPSVVRYHDSERMSFAMVGLNAFSSRLFRL